MKQQTKVLTPKEIEDIKKAKAKAIKKLVKK